MDLNLNNNNKMKVKCIFNTGKNIPISLYTLYGYTKNTIFDSLTIGKSYTVYSIFTMKGELWYLVCPDFFNGTNYNYPEFYPSTLFEVTDTTPSKYWITKPAKDDYDKGNKLVNNTGFINIINEEFFYGNLVEGNEREILLFKEYKQLIDSE